MAERTGTPLTRVCPCHAWLTPEYTHNTIDLERVVLALLVALTSSGCSGERQATWAPSVWQKDQKCIKENEPTANDQEPLDLEDINTKDFQLPKHFDMADVVEAITGPNSAGYIKLENMFSAKDVELARERALYYTNTKHYMKMIKKKDKDALHNNYVGLTWSLLNKGKIFEKIVQHPVLYNISNAVLGLNAQISSLATNTVLPGMEGQKPHLDYPYYKSLMSPLDMVKSRTLTLTFLIMLTEFTKENGGTAVRGGSHVHPKHPEDVDDFFAHADQITGQPGDVVVFSGALQHCAMPNNSNMFRSAIIMQMATVYMKTFEDIVNLTQDSVKTRATPTLRTLLGLDHTFPLKNLA